MPGSDFVPFPALSLQLPEPADRLSLLTSPLFRRLFVVAAHSHLAIQAFALHLLLERAQGLVDIIVANLNFHGALHSSRRCLGKETGLPPRRWSDPFGCL